MRDGEKVDENTKVRAVRLVRAHAGDYQTEWAAMKAISARLSAETLRKWVRQAEVDAGEAAGVPTETARELRELRRKCQIVTASITKEAVEELGLAEGTAATVLVKSTEVMLAVD